MKVLVAADAHIYKLPNNTYWTPKIYGYSFWGRYLEVFDEVRIASRVKEVQRIDDKWIRVDGEKVEVYGIPFFQGPKELASKYIDIQTTMRDIYNGCDAAIYRMPSQTSYMVYKKRRKDMPCAGEIVFDPTDSIKDSSLGVFVRFIDIIVALQLRSFCKKVNGVSYVTEHTIQNRFPSIAKMKGETREYFESSYSTITLRDDAYTGPRDFRNKKTFSLIMSDVSMNGERKGERVVIQIVKMLNSLGYDVSATIIGDGSKRHEFEDYAKKCEISDKIFFTGLLPSSDDVREELLKSDIFVFPTKGEGLPRGVLEAMATGMPVVTTPVGGIPEVIEEEFLFHANDIEGFIGCLQRLMNNPEKMNIISAKNYEKSLEFRNDILQKKRNAFYRKLAALAK